VIVISAPGVHSGTQQALFWYAGGGGGPEAERRAGPAGALRGSYAVAVAGWGVFSHRNGARISWYRPRQLAVQCISQ
jgi:hypothetical protein